MAPKRPAPKPARKPAARRKRARADAVAAIVLGPAAPSPQPAARRRRRPPPRPKCTATSKQTGQPCGNHPALGLTVCKFHGGAAPQVKLAAKQRLAALADPALTVFERFLTPASDVVAIRGVDGKLSIQLPVSDELVFRAAQDVLNRTGHKAVTKIEVISPIDYGRLTDEELQVALRLGLKLQGKTE